MYGIIHTALRDMVLETFGQDKWTEILNLAGVGDSAFVRMQTYDDSIVLSLVGASSQVLETPAEECLELFGRYWITYASKDSYEKLMDATGSKIVTFIKNINSLHDRITSTFSGYVPPEFYINSLDDNNYEVTYVSTRNGFMHFVRGLLFGLGDRFGNELVILKQKQLDVESGESWVFTIHIKQ